jgi:hypothetical protein
VRRNDYFQENQNIILAQSTFLCKSERPKLDFRGGASKSPCNPWKPYDNLGVDFGIRRIDPIRGDCTIERYLRIAKNGVVRIDRGAVREAERYDGKWSSRPTYTHQNSFRASKNTTKICRHTPIFQILYNYTIIIPFPEFVDLRIRNGSPGRFR